MKTAIIVNPIAGRGKTDQIWPLLENVLKTRNYPYKVYFTGTKGDGTKIAQYLVDKVERLVVVGGDGTIHEVVQSIINRKVGLAVVPTGTGNDLARSLGIPRDPFKALDLLFQGHPKQIDVGKVNDRYFVNIAGVGFDAIVVNAVNTSFKHIKGSLAYLMALFKVLSTYRNVKVRVSIGETSLTTKSLLVAVGNGACYGGGMKIAPGAILDDGLLDLCLVGDVTKLEILQTLPKIFSGRHVTHPKVVMLKGQEIKIEAQAPMVIQADGEIIGQAPAVIQVVSKALTIMVPNKGKKSDNF